MTASLQLKIEQAARLRAAGQRWADIATTVGRKLDTVEGWPEQFQSIWSPVFEQALLDHQADLEAHDRLIAQRLREAEVDAVDGMLKLSQGRLPGARDPQCPANVIQSALHSLLTHAGRQRAQRVEIKSDGAMTLQVSFPHESDEADPEG